MILVGNGHNDIGGDADGYANCRCNGDETLKKIKDCSCIGCIDVSQPPLSEVKGGFRTHFSLGA